MSRANEILSENLADLAVKYTDKSAQLRAARADLLAANERAGEATGSIAEAKAVLHAMQLRGVAGLGMHAHIVLRALERADSQLNPVTNKVGILGDDGVDIGTTDFDAEEVTQPYNRVDLAQLARASGAV